MKSEDMLDMIGDIDDNVIKDAEYTQQKSVRRGHRFKKWIISAAGVFIAVAITAAVVISIRKPESVPDDISGSPEKTADASDTKTVSAPLSDEAALKKAENVPNNGAQKNTMTTAENIIGKNTPGYSKLKNMSLVYADYPETVPFPLREDFTDSSYTVSDSYDKAYEKWWKASAARRNSSVFNRDGYKKYNQLFIKELLSDTTENRCFSPLNLFLGLGMLTEVTEGESQKEILDLLGYSNIEELRQLCNELWNSCYINDGATFSIPAASIWLNDKVGYNHETLQRLADNYYASAFSGKMGSEEYNQLFKDWLNYQTGDLLKNQSESLNFDPETVLALATTICFRAKWQVSFYEENTNEVFHSPNGDIECEYMHSENTGIYFFGDKFASINLPLDRNQGSMWFILPDEGISCDELLANDEALDFIISGNENWPKNKCLTVNKVIPKFDIASDINIKEKLTDFGVNKIFDFSQDFAPLYEGNEIDTCLSKITHAARVAIDEEGVTAAAYTVEILCGAGMPPEERVDFILDRPFIFVLKNDVGLPLFTGIVNQP